MYPLPPAEYGVLNAENGTPLCQNAVPEISHPFRALRPSLETGRQMGANFQLASGYTSQTTETLHLQPIPFLSSASSMFFC